MKLMKPAPLTTPTSRRGATGAEQPTVRQESASTEFWRAERVARYFDVSRKRIYQLVQEKKLEAVRLSPRTLRIPRDSVERFQAELLATGIGPAGDLGGH